MIRYLLNKFRKTQKIDVCILFFGGIGTDSDRSTPEYRQTAYEDGLKRLILFTKENNISIKFTQQFLDLGILCCKLKKQDFSIIQNNLQNLHIDQITESKSAIKIEHIEDNIFSEKENNDILYDE